jgi:hypothetical protein
MFLTQLYQDADKSLARPTSQCILFDGKNILFDASLFIYIYINSTNIPPIMIINRIYERQILLSLWLVSFLVGLRTYQQLRITISIPVITSTPQKICVPLLFISVKQTLQKSRIQPTFWLDDHGELCGTLS